MSKRLSGEQRRSNRVCIALPKGLSKDGERACRLIKKFLHSRKLTYTGGCKAFYTPKEWNAKENANLSEALLVVVYDGGDLARVFCLAYGGVGLNNSVMALLKDNGFWLEELNHWSAVIYKSKLKQHARIPT